MLLLQIIGIDLSIKRVNGFDVSVCASSSRRLGKISANSDRTNTAFHRCVGERVFRDCACWRMTNCNSGKPAKETNSSYVWHSATTRNHEIPSVIRLKSDWPHMKCFVTSDKLTVVDSGIVYWGCVTTYNWHITRKRNDWKQNLIRKRNLLRLWGYDSLMSRTWRHAPKRCNCIKCQTKNDEGAQRRNFTTNHQNTRFYPRSGP